MEEKPRRVLDEVVTPPRACARRLSEVRVTPPRACARHFLHGEGLGSECHSPARVCEASSMRDRAGSDPSLPRARVRGCKA